MVRITDPDALDKLASVEGEPWKRDTSTRESPYTFKGILATFQRYMTESKGRRGCSATIYGRKQTGAERLACVGEAKKNKGKTPTADRFVVVRVE
jgi:hypothetical protein